MTGSLSDMYGIFNKETGKLDCDPEPMTFDDEEIAEIIKDAQE